MAAVYTWEGGWAVHGRGERIKLTQGEKKKKRQEEWGPHYRASEEGCCCSLHHR